MALNPNDTLLNGHYRILRLLGRGGFGFVYEARDTLLNQKVAIKELIPALVSDEAMLKRFLAEARATMRLTHRHIVRTHNVFQEGENYYIVMEHMAGGSLEERLRKSGALPADKAVRVAAEVCEGLACAHEEQVVHCDLKPANILFDASGRAKVADFGIAHISGETLTRSWMTPAGFAAGTLPFMSPEQIDGVRDEPRIDIYALGAMLYWMLTGRTYLDFDERETPGAQAQNVLRIQNQPPEPPSAQNRRVPPWLDRVVLKALAKRPEKRYADASQMRTALLRGVAGTGVPSATVPPSPADAPGARPARQPMPDRQRRVLAWSLAGAAGVLLVALVTVLALFWGGGQGTPTPTVPTTQVVLGPPTATTPVPAATATLTVTPTPSPGDTATPTLTSTPLPSPSPSPSPTPTPTPGSPGADEVIAYNPGPGIQTRYQDPEALLGAPDLVESPCCQGMAQLGRGGSVLLALVDNVILDGDGPDFQVYGESARDDFLLVEVSVDGQTWKAFPKVSESPGGLDLADVGLAQAMYVRLTDLQPGTSTGAEVDAVVALHNGPALSAPPDLPDAVARDDLALHEGPDRRMTEVGQVPAGAALAVLGRNLVSGWAKVQVLSGQSGWVPIADLGLNVTLGDRALAQAPPTPTPRATSTPNVLRVGSTQTRAKDSMVMVYVPAGEFTMGSNEGYGDEKPVHTVTLDAYWIDRTEVTNAQYHKCVEAGVCTAPADNRSSTRSSYYGNSHFSNYPVILVNWFQANAYCRWAGARLPTEAQWEKAARGTDGRVYPWGNQDPGCDRANYAGCVGDTSEVGRYPSGASPYGVLDMAGNVWEWVADWYGSSYYSSSPSSNPQGPPGGTFKVLHGGSWQHDLSFARAADRSYHYATDRFLPFGFRCAASPGG